MDIFVARQPVFDAQKKVFGYELLFRNGLENSFPDIDGDTATTKVLSNVFFSFDFNDILGNKPGLVNFTKNTILNKMPLIFPREHIIIEILENIEPLPEVIDALREFKTKGFTIALDDFVYQDRFEPMIDLCQIIKFDLIATPLDSLSYTLNDIRYRWPEITLLAEKVETYDIFEQAGKMGFSLFQGYFFSRPEIISGKDIPPSQLSQITLINTIEKEDVSPDEIENQIKNDIGISYKLLRFINSAYFQIPNPIHTIRDAILFLGSDELRQFIRVAVVSSLASDKPDELTRKAIIRARMCQHLSGIFRSSFTPEMLFTLGLFSLLDAILDQKMDRILQQLTLSDAMKQALAGREKGFAGILGIIRIFENGDWENPAFESLVKAGVAPKILRFYKDSIKMADSFFQKDGSGN